MPENSTSKDRLKEITDSIEAGIKDLFQSEKYMQYLRTMSRFHKYSVNNTMLIYMQKPDATICAGFNKWKNQFERNVKKGEKGIKIIAPTPYKKKIEEAKLDPDTKQPMLDADGTVITEEKTVQIPMYKVVSVFDISQTDGKPLPELAANLTGDVQNYEVFIEALRRSSPVPISIETMSADMDGYFDTEHQDIAIRKGMSEVQTVSAVIHEIAHAKLHNYQKAQEQAAAGDETALPVKRKSRETEEIEAESISYSVCAYYNVETGANSFGYLATWSKDKELSALRESLETINKTSSGLITDIDRNYAAIMKERGLDKAQPEQESPAVEYLMHANPRTTGDADRFFVQAYAKQDGELIPGEVIGIGTAEQCREISGALTAGNMTVEDAKAAFTTQPEHQPGYEEWSEPATADNAPEVLDTPSDDAAAYLPEQNKDTTAVKEAVYPMPDPTLTMEDMHSYGYLDGDMLPVSKSRALELMEQDVTIFCLKQGTHFERAADPWEVNNYDGMLGISADIWEEIWTELPPHDLQQNVAAEPQPEIGVEETPAATAPENGYLPDPAMTVEAMNAYGYTDADMLPLSRERAIELFQKDLTVYMLYDDNTEAMAFDTDEIITFDGILGISRGEWENYRESAAMPEVGAFSIYQLRQGEENRDYSFRSYSELEENHLTVDRNRYELKYADVLPVAGDNMDQLNEIYRRFNIERPADFTGHSLSVSDIVVIRRPDEVSCHYVDSFGFKEVPTFLKPENYLKSAEMSMEDDYGMIDGIVNNGPKQPTVAELEQQAKSGTPISLMDLAAAVHRERNSGRKEKKPSVLEQLKSYQEKEKTNIAPKKSAEREL